MCCHSSWRVYCSGSWQNAPRRCMVFRCLHKMAPEYLSTYCQPVSGISGRRHLRSADRGHLDFPHVKLASYGGRSFAYAGPSNWNSLPAHLRDNSLSLSSFKRHLKTFLFSFYEASTRSAFGNLFTKTRYINSLLLLLLFNFPRYWKFRDLLEICGICHTSLGNFIYLVNF